MHDYASRLAYSIREEERQRAVDESGLVEGKGRDALQAIVDRAARRFSAPMAALSVIDGARQWFAARRALPAETPREQSICAHAIQRPGEMLVVQDAHRDARFARNPLVLGAPHIRFYAGMPIVDRSGFALGALCILDVKPRPSGDDLFDLTLFAREAERVINR